MEVDDNTVRRIARLARIRIAPDEVAMLQGELSGILDWVKQLDEVDTANVEPMTRVVPIDLKMRPDEVTDGEMPAAVLDNAPATEDGFYVVPKIVE
jgi:aspartyl-tRNA(Asn)/glutamyl-tRNA(Gln) amidotransferase subunit C